MVRNVSRLPGPSVPSLSVWINDPSPGEAAEALTPGAGQRFRLYTLSLLSAEALQVGCILIINNPTE